MWLRSGRGLVYGGGFVVVERSSGRRARVNEWLAHVELYWSAYGGSQTGSIDGNGGGGEVGSICAVS
jgi:hypothetical protein